MDRLLIAYRDAFTLLLGYAERTLGKAPTVLVLGDLTPELIAARRPALSCPV